MALTYYASGFNNGWVDINYPVDITLTFQIMYNHSRSMGYCKLWLYSLPSAYLNPHFLKKELKDEFFIWNKHRFKWSVMCRRLYSNKYLNVDVPYDSLTLIELNTYSGIATYPCIVNNYPDICQSQVIPLLLMILVEQVYLYGLIYIYCFIQWLHIT
jgi:hypothetical protein